MALPEISSVIAVSNGFTLSNVAVKEIVESVPSTIVPPSDQVTSVSSLSIKFRDSVFWLLFILASLSPLAKAAVIVIVSVGSSVVFAAPSFIVIEAEDWPAEIVRVEADSE